MGDEARTDRCVEISHIPDSPPIPPDQQPTVSVFASVINEPKQANALIRRLNQVAPLENLRHVKRIHKRRLEGGKVQLSILVCLASGEDDNWNSLPQGLKELIEFYQLSPFVTQVCKYAATSKEQWEEQCRLWPTSYHPPTFNIDGITGFSDEDAQSVYQFMKLAIKLAKSSDNLITNAAVIVDPSVQQIIASACDQTHSWDNYTNKNDIAGKCNKQPSAPNYCNGSNKNDIAGKCVAASCLSPWQWSQTTSNFHDWHPLRHAALVAIESSSDRDRRLFPCSDNDAKQSFEEESVLSVCARPPAKRQKPHHETVEAEDGLDSCNEYSSSATTRPYLCTGYDIYLVWEPCPMCAMALVHQRIRRIFYAFPNTNAGALGSVHRLQGEKSLNHHYAVFRVKFLNESLLF
ncbi:tRNA-specific adenosine deaminase TAD3 [Linum grandiflorum]